MYIVVSCVDRQLMCSNLFEKKSEAKEYMENDFKKVFEECYKTAFTPETYTAEQFDEGCSLNEESAWLNGRDSYDWDIFEVAEGAKSESESRDSDLLTKRLIDNAIEIVWCVEDLQEEGKIKKWIEIFDDSPTGSDGIKDLIAQIAVAFEKKYKNYDWQPFGDYLDKIAEFAEEKLLEEYGVEEESAAHTSVSGMIDIYNNAIQQAKENLMHRLNINMRFPFLKKEDCLELIEQYANDIKNIDACYQTMDECARSVAYELGLATDKNQEYFNFDKFRDTIEENEDYIELSSGAVVHVKWR